MTLSGVAGSIGGNDAASPGAAVREHWRKIAVAVAMAVATAGILAVDYYVIGLDALFIAVVLALTLWSLVEFYAMCEARGTSPFARFGVVSGVMLAALNWVATPGTLAWFAPRLGIAGRTYANLQRLLSEDLVRFGLVVAVLGAIWFQATKRDNDRTFESISTTLFGILYVWFLSSFLTKLRHLGADGTLGGPDWNVVGSGLLFSGLLVTKLADIGGYLFGRRYGRHRMIPRISPRKSYEGLAAGLALSIASGAVLQNIGCLPFASIWHGVLFGALVGGMGVLGDLAESLLKRGSGRKDAGTHIPGFGGILDVVDSILLSAPVAYFLSLILLKQSVG